jgi:hypothetical protein
MGNIPQTESQARQNPDSRRNHDSTIVQNSGKLAMGGHRARSCYDGARLETPPPEAIASLYAKAHYIHMNTFPDRLSVRVRLGVPRKVRILAALRGERIGELLSNLVEQALAQEQAAQAKEERRGSR